MILRFIGGIVTYVRAEISLEPCGQRDRARVPQIVIRSLRCWLSDLGPSSGKVSPLRVLSRWSTRFVAI